MGMVSALILKPELAGNNGKELSSCKRGKGETTLHTIKKVWNRLVLMEYGALAR